MAKRWLIWQRSKMNWEEILDNILYIALILSGLLCLVASGKEIARTITEISAGEYWNTLFDALWAIWLFAIGVRNIIVAWRYLRTKFGS